MRLYLTQSGGARRWLRALAPLLALAGAARAQTYNTGEASNAGTLYHGGSFTNAAGASFLNTGSAATAFYAGSTFTNAGRYTASAGATDQFIGPAGAAGPQELGGTAAPRFFNLTLANGTSAAFTVSNSQGVRVSQLLTLNNGITSTVRTTPAGAIRLLPGATIGGGTLSDARYVDGYVGLVGGTANTAGFVLPVGTGGAYQPLTLTTALTNAADSVRTAYFNADPGTTPNPSDNATHPRTSLGPGLLAVSPVAFWDWARPASASMPLDVSVALPAGLSIPASRLRLAGWNAATARWENLSGTTGIASNARGSALTGTVPPGITALALGDQPTITAAPVVLLQGAYNNGAFRMNTTLNGGSTSILASNALTQPYNVAPFNYPGTETVTAAFFAANPNIVDWVLVDLRDATTPTTIIATRAAFVLNTGQVVDLDGSSPVNFTAAFVETRVAPFTGTYYVGIRHRNHLPIRTADVQTFDGVSPVAYDFTTAQTRAYQNYAIMANAAMVAVPGSGGTPRYALIGGNTNGNSTVRYAGPSNDNNALINGCLGGDAALILTPVYSNCDLNMNGVVRYAGPNNDNNFLINTVLGGDQAIIFQQHL